MIRVDISQRKDEKFAANEFESFESDFNPAGHGSRADIMKCELISKMEDIIKLYSRIT